MTKPIEETKIEDLIKFPVAFEEYGGQFILDRDQNMICQIRGWGRLQYRIDEKGNKVLDEENGAKLQDYIGHFIADAINSHAENDRLREENEILLQIQKVAMEVYSQREHLFDEPFDAVFFNKIIKRIGRANIKYLERENQPSVLDRMLSQSTIIEFENDLRIEKNDNGRWHIWDGNLMVKDSFETPTEAFKTVELLAQNALSGGKTNA